MGWTDLSELLTTDGEVLDAADLILIRDNLEFLYRKPIVTVRLTSVQPVASGSDDRIDWDEAVWDFAENAMWDAGTPGSIVIDRPGKYHIDASASWEGTTEDNSKRDVSIELNGTTRLKLDSRGATSSPEGGPSMYTSLDTGDYLEIFVRHLAGQEIDLQPNRTRCTVAWWGPSE